MCQIKNISVSSMCMTDHRIVDLRIDDSNTIHGPGKWICNNTLLDDIQCKERIHIFGDYWKTKNRVCIMKWWDLGKIRLKEIITDYSKEKRYKEKQLKVNLENIYNNMLADGNCSLEQIKYFLTNDLYNGANIANLPLAVVEI